MRQIFFSFVLFFPMICLNKMHKNWKLWRIFFNWNTEEFNFILKLNQMQHGERKKEFWDCFVVFFCKKKKIKKKIKIKFKFKLKINWKEKDNWK